jgi:hypothetical protein
MRPPKNPRREHNALSHRTKCLCSGGDGLSTPFQQAAVSSNYTRGVADPSPTAAGKADRVHRVGARPCSGLIVQEAQPAEVGR